MKNMRRSTIATAGCEFSLAFALGLLLAACGAGGGSSTDATTSSSSTGGACIPGAQLACACPDDAQGVQVCRPDGSGLDACQGCGSASCAQSAQKLYYHDADQDSYGGPDTQMACEPPGPDWVLQGGDCDDASALVHPGQTTYFPEPYDLGSSVSFDYDCDGQETRDPAAVPVLALDAMCTGDPLKGPCTGGSGYLPTGRTGAGVDPYCGSTSYGSCEKGYDGEFSTWYCGMSLSTVAPVGCR